MLTAKIVDKKPSGDGEAKYWLEPEIALAKSIGYSNKQLKRIELLVKVFYQTLTSIR